MRALGGWQVTGENRRDSRNRNESCWQNPMSAAGQTIKKLSVTGIAVGGENREVILLGPFHLATPHFLPVSPQFLCIRLLSSFPSCLLTCLGEGKLSKGVKNISEPKLQFDWWAQFGRLSAVRPATKKRNKTVSQYNALCPLSRQEPQNC